MNIKANELRLGNLIRFNNFIGDERNVTVNARFFASMAGGRPFTEVEGSNNAELNNYYSGIVLTPEILEKCGFEYVTDWTVRDKRKHDCVTFLDLGYMYLASGMMGGGVTLFQNDRRSTGTNIDYLHQLQNLYYCLCSEELEVKL